MLKRVLAHPNFPVLVLILLNLVIGASVVSDYGESWDEQRHYRFGEDSLRAYTGNVAADDLDLDDKGPSYAMMAVLVSKALRVVRPGWGWLESWDFTHFLSFLLGLFFLYRLCLLLVGKWAALAAALIYNTQPLLWGHAFINPKDTALMAFFLASVTTGLEISRSQILQESKPLPFVRRLLAALKDWHVLLAALLLGLTCSMRTTGPVAGALVAVYLLLKFGRRAIPTILVYGTVAAAVAYVTWPGLWGSPLAYLASLRTAANFPWMGKVFFEGADYFPKDLPRYYLPKLIAMQYTEPTLLLGLVGVIISAIYTWKSRYDWRLIGLLAAWLFLPILGAVVARPPLYDNARQLLFIIPPLFVFAAVAFQWLFDRLRTPVLAVLLVAVCLAPGIYAILRLHPYQYVYYNSLPGSVAGAGRAYDLDYWGSAYQEGVEYINQVAPEGAKILVWGPVHIVKRQARPDLKIINYRQNEQYAPDSLSYFMVSSRHNKDRYLYPEAPQLFEVSRAGAVLLVVKDLRQANTSNP
jgi:4-amino-4-deoxy-L-arabinose transferase-like glycosyltransferase